MADPPVEVEPVELAEDDVVPYLMSCGLMSRRDVVDGGVRVMEASGRNRSYRVVARCGPSYLVKQGVLRDGFSSTRREARAYEVLGVADWTEPLPAGAYPAATSARHYDPDRDILVVDLAVGARSVRETRARRPGPRATRMLGVALADLHRHGGHPSVRELAERRLGEGEPGVLSVQRPGVALLRDFSSACVDLVRLLQQSGDVAPVLEDLRRDWRADGLIHHDVRWENVLLPPTPSADHLPPVLLVDWETAALGDRAWDVGCVLGECLGDWLRSVPGAGREPPETFLHLARFPLPRARHLAHAFWHGYRERAGLDGPDSADLLIRSTRYAGLKLIQSGLEQVHGAPRWTLGSVALLQTGTNILRRPQAAAQVLLAFQEAS